MRCLLAAALLVGVSARVGMYDYSMNPDCPKPPKCTGEKKDDKIMICSDGSGGAACPLHIDFIKVGDRKGKLGMSMLPGRSKKDTGSVFFNRSVVDDVNVIKKAGAFAVISLIEGAPHHPEHSAYGIPSADALEKERQEYERYGVDAHGDRPSLVKAVRDAGMEHYSVPVEDMQIASAATWNYLKDLAPKVMKRVLDGGYAHIHCVGGHGRTGTLVAQLVFASKMDSLLEQARQDTIKAVRAARHDTIETPEQEKDVVRGLDLWHAMRGEKCEKKADEERTGEGKKAGFAQQHLNAD